MSTEPSSVGDELVALAKLIAVDRVRHEEEVRIVQRDRPEGLDRRKLPFLEVHDVLVVRAVIVVPARVFLREWIHRILRTVPSRPQHVAHGAQRIIGTPVADAGGEVQPAIRRLPVFQEL